MRRTCCSKTDWVDIKWKGGVMKHPVQQDGNSCGVVVCMCLTKKSTVPCAPAENHPAQCHITPTLTGFSVTAVSGGATRSACIWTKSLEEAQVGDWVCSLCNK
ncbi:hypothetical protein F7725_003030 [Dissostichus mawsoni]|uniref:Uncharacterized protein n=1 Tax=Dissostichus mawsoni TaxID=36200 RepID=A0A7J5Y906_DISMA|nr:hypothetical protein F7725_003030 [Dissostichus mawsoni]